MEQLKFEAGKNMVLVEGKIYLLKDTSNIDFNHPIIKHKYEGRNIIATTNTELTGIHHIPREWFVRKVDLDRLAYDFAEKSKCDWEDEHFVNEAFKAGYNANKSEFTRDELFTAMNLAWTTGALDSNRTSHDIIKELRPLQLPQSITVTKDFKQVIETIWKD